MAATDKLAATVGTGRYDAWGVPLAQTGAIPQYGYTGREPDATGLVYYRARYYDPSITRFTQRDPLGLVAGINRYAYVMNNPVNRVDPLGTMAQVYPPGREPTSYPSAIRDTRAWATADDGSVATLAMSSNAPGDTDEVLEGHALPRGCHGSA